ncbi:hypothetical protein L208DRAFT_1486561 [Tricholoma matsutake]|nr:hypothetical protein L208DRAFT_1486561 [Tricholoma matsutake 945]
MPRCPNCSRKWPDQMSVLAHMNQPLGSCYSYQEEMTSFADELWQFHRRKKMQTIMGNSHQEDAMAEVQVDMDVDMIEFVPLEKDPHFIEEYKGAAQSFGSGTTFMDEFNSDAYRSERIDTPYYPFASKYKWELASFLLLSDLSMASITKLLSLHLASPMTKM